MKHTKQLLLFLLIILLYVQSHAQNADKITAGISSDRVKRYENFIKEEINNGSIPGAVSLVMRQGEVVHQAAFGYRNVVDKTPMKIDDLFYIQSMTKPIITIAFMMLYEEGHFQLSDPVSKYLPAFKDMRVAKSVNDGKDVETLPANKPITIANLLSHTAGLSHGIGSSNLDRDIGKSQYGQPYTDIASRVNNLATLPLVGQPGEQWYYSAAPDVLSVLIEKFSGMSTNNFLIERIFKSLGMQDTGYNLTKAQQARVVKVHQKNDQGVLVNSTNQPKMEGVTVWSGVNALYSTASDYMIFCQMLMNGGKWNGKQFLSRKTIELMTYNHTEKLFGKPGEGFGLGFAVLTNVAETKGLGSEGLFYWSGAFNTHFFIDPKEKIIAIWMTQVNPHTITYHEKMRQFVYQAIID